jgi:hypothetical protein
MKTFFKFSAIFAMTILAITSQVQAETAKTTFPWTEGFESTTFPPTGWRIMTLWPSGSDVTWTRTTVARNVRTGVGAALHLDNRDGWSETALITPAITLPSTRVTLEFWSRMEYSTSFWAHGTNGVWISTTNADNWSAFTQIYDFDFGEENVNEWWNQISISLEPYIGQTVYIAFVYDANDGHRWAIDDVTITAPVENPVFEGSRTLAFDTVFKGIPRTYTKTYIIENKGPSPLTISASSVQPTAGLTVTGLPLNIPSLQSQTITITFDPTSVPAGVYSGSFVLATNDPQNVQVAVEVTANVFDAVVKNFISEDFDDIANGQRPAGWLSNDNRFSVRANGGINNSKRLAANLWNNQFARQAHIQTGFVQMGAEPEFSFNYRFVNDANYPTVATPSNNISFTVEISEDYGASWTTLLNAGTGTHAASTAYRHRTLDVSQYANKTCMVRFMFRHHNGDFWADLDDITIGTMPNTPEFEGPTTVAFGDVVNNIPGTSGTYIRTYTVRNRGGGNLTVDRFSASSQLTFSGLPLTVAPLETATFSVTLNPYEISNGAYSGNFVLTTNDTENPQVTVGVTANASSVFVEGFIFETFDNLSPVAGTGTTGTVGVLPEHWTTNVGSALFATPRGFMFQTRADGGLQNSQRLSANIFGGTTWNNQMAMIETPYVDMGESPVLSFFYRVLVNGSNAPSNVATPSENFTMFVSVQRGISGVWDTIFRMQPTDHMASVNYALRGIDVSAYANDICKIRIAFRQLTGDHWACLDNITLGTPALMNDLEATLVVGEFMSNAGTALMKEGDPYTFTVEVRNNGANPQTNYTVKLMQEGGIELGSLVGIAIASSEVKKFDFVWTPTMSGISNIYGEVVFVGDELPENNISPNLRTDIMPEDVADIRVHFGTGFWALPYDFRSRQSLTQSLYFPHEIGTNGGTIHGLAYQSHFETDTIRNRAIQIWIGETDLNDLSGGWVDPSTLTLVFDGELSFERRMWVYTDNVFIPFDRPYEYTGRNLVVYSFKEDNTPTAATNAFYGMPTTPNRSRILTSNNPINPATPAAGTASDRMPNIVFMTDMAGMGSLSGVVSDANGVVEDVNVRLIGYQFSKRTDENGAYAFPFLVAGNYQIEVSKFGYLTDTINVTIAEGADVVQNITILPRPTFTVSGTVIGNDAPSGLANVQITLTGYDDYSTTTDANGDFSIAGVFGSSDYELTANLTGYTTYTSTITVGNAAVVYDFTMVQILHPVIQPRAEIVSNNAVITWRTPGTFEPKSYVLDDGTAENGFSINPNAEFWLGNKFVVGEIGELTSVDIFGVNNSDYTGRLVTVDIYNEQRELVGSSAPFTFLNNNWINVPLNHIPYFGTFYAMVHWPETPGETHYLGYDQNGPNANGNFNYLQTENGLWALMHEAGGSQGVFMIRANANSEGPVPTKVSYAASDEHLPKINISAVAFGDLNHVRSMENPETVDAPNVETDNYPSLQTTKSSALGYHVFRLEEGTPESAWTTLATGISELTYTDVNWSTLPSGIYQYAVKAEYMGGYLSDVRFTNFMPKDMEVDYTVNLTTNSEDSPVGAVLTLTNQNHNLDLVYTQTATSASVNFPIVWKGTYTLEIRKDGFETQTITDIVIDQIGLSRNVELIEIIADPVYLKVEVQKPIATFSWNNTPTDFFDDMESYDDFIIENIGEYTLHDLDGGRTVGFLNASFPNSGYTGSFIVFNPSGVNPSMDGDAAIQPYSGSKFLACFASSAAPNNDWLVLPKREVRPGTEFSFMARSYTTYYGAERFRVAISTTGTDPEDFTIISGAVSVPAAWTKYTFDLSVYAGQDIHVAIICVSNDAFIFMVDDIFFGIPNPTKIAEKAGKALTGYNVYLDGEKVGTTLDTEWQFTLAPGDYIAGVEAVFTTGTSNRVTIQFTVPLKEVGAVVGTPVFASATHNSITILPVTPPTNGQTVEYNISTNNIPPLSGWQESLTFAGLSPNQQFFIVARSKENDDFYAGAVSTSLVAFTTEENSIRDVETDNSLQIYPNPVTDYLQFTIYDLRFGDKIEIFDMNGKRVYVERLPDTGHQSLVTINISHLPNGMYVVKIGTKSAKIIKNAN